MYFHLGQDYILNDRDVIGIFDMDTTTVSARTRKFLRLAESEGAVIGGRAAQKLHPHRLAQRDHGVHQPGLFGDAGRPRPPRHPPQAPVNYNAIRRSAHGPSAFPGKAEPPALPVSVPPIRRAGPAAKNAAAAPANHLPVPCPAAARRRNLNA